MNLLYLSVQGLQLFESGFNIDFIAKQRVTENNDEGLTHLHQSIYKQDIIGVTGINASGKTFVLRWINFILDIYLKEGKLNDEDYQTFLMDRHLEFEAYFMDESNVYKIHSEIARNEEDEYIFGEEILWKKKRLQSLNRSSIFDFTNKKIEFKRSEEKSLFLSDNMSIMIAQMKQKSHIPKVYDLLPNTNINMIRVIGDVPTSIIQYLDESVEYVKSELLSNKYIRLKFKKQDKEIFIHDPLELFQYLSSGTVKGLNVFAAIQRVIISGGFLIIDELENHFNQSIVQTIIQLFKNKKINKYGATLIFSTHYAELLDDFDRTDNIYIALKKDSLELKKLSDIMNRNDYKKSEIYQSGGLEKTAPSYESYMNLKRYLIKYVSDIPENGEEYNV